MRMLSYRFPLALICLLTAPQVVLAQENPWELKSLTLEGGPIATKHFQGGEENYRERHGLAVLKAETAEYGTWGLYFLNPNSVDRTSVGAGYITKPYVVPLAYSMDLEFSGALGLVTGYQDYPVPLIVGEARLGLFEEGPWDVGVAMATNPYIMQEKDSGDNNFGMVVTSPFLSIRYKFQ